jgi:hypothetical protein
MVLIFFSKTLVKSIFIKFILIEFSIQLDINEKSDDVQNLLIEDVEHSLFLNSGFPIYFKCKFHVFGKNYSIFFRKTDHFNSYLNHGQEKMLYQNYNSVLDYSSNQNIKANCALFLNTYSYEIFKINFSSNYDSFFNNWLKYQNNLQETFDIILKLIEKDSKNSEFTNFDLHISMDFRFYEKKSNKKYYEAHMKRIASFSTETNRRQRKQINRNSKTHLTVESCIHLHNNVMERIKKYLKTSDEDYIKMYTLLKYSIMIFNANKIYEKIKDPYISIAVELVDIQILPKQSLKVNTNSKTSLEFLDDFSKFARKFYDERTTKCDHVFLLHNFRWAELGLTRLGSVCPDNIHFTSLIADNIFVDVTCAHELAHNLGAYHDDHTISRKFSCNYKANELMHPSSSFQKSIFKMSECTIKQFKDYLLDKNYNLKSEFLCLGIKNNQIKTFQKFDRKALEKLPGYHFSLSDQCRYSK